MSKREDSIDKLRRIVLEETIKASREYMVKEKVREDLQKLIAARVASGEIKDEVSLKDFWKTLEMASLALKMIPVEAFRGGKE
jgi:hypothetical protein